MIKGRTFLVRKREKKKCIIDGNCLLNASIVTKTEKEKQQFAQIVDICLKTQIRELSNSNLGSLEFTIKCEECFCHIMWKQINSQTAE